MKRSAKEQLVTELRDKIKGANALYFTDFTGLNVKRMTELRRRFRKAGVEYVVIKNSLALRAVNESGLTGSRLRGPTGVVVAKDAISAAKVLVDFAKENDQKPATKGGIFEGNAIDEAMVKKLATMPTREEALSQFVSALNSVLMMFALALDARKTQLESAGGAPAAESASPDAPADAPVEAPAADAPAASTDAAAEGTGTTEANG
jgi:large subunit ribosomal protein L10